MLATMSHLLREVVLRPECNGVWESLELSAAGKDGF